MIKKDLHGYTTEEATDEIFQCLRDAIKARDNSVEIIHGHSHGTKIRDYLDSCKFQEDCQNEGIFIINKSRHSKGGATTLTIEILAPNSADIRPDGESRWEKLCPSKRITL